MTSSIQRYAFYLFGLGAAITAFVAAGLYIFQSKLIYPSNFPAGSRTHVDTPDSQGMPSYKDVTIETADGEKIKAFVVLHDESEPNYVPKTVLLLCPNAGNMGHALPIVRLFYQQMGYNAVIFSYRGYGLSTGTASEVGIKTDARALYNYLQTHPQIKNTSLVLYGRSLGGAVAIYMASQFGGSEGSIIKGLILENTFLSIPKLIGYVLPFAAPFARLCHQKWESEKLMPLINPQIPTMFLSGLRDEIVPPPHMKGLIGMCPADVKVVEYFANGTHNDTIVQPEYWEKLVMFIRKYVVPIESHEKEKEEHLH
ncbi:Hypothetical protein YALI2_D00514g [Yarrowia lipolytica]|jgi:fermentation-respiration switch protein FrsA (DUF1100 family)|nr:Hypothetical protein YALI2_D00514g [Yarrowia lipolytica]